MPTSNDSCKASRDVGLWSTAASGLVGAVVVCVLAALADVLVRRDVGAAGAFGHGVATIAVLAPFAVLAGAVAAAWGVFVSVLAPHVPRLSGTLLVSLATGIAAAALAKGSIRATLGGLAQRAPEDAILAERAAIALVLIAFAVVAAIVLVAARRRAAVGAVIGFGLLLCAAALAWADLTQLVALYARAHDLAEMCAWVCGTAGAALVVRASLRRWPRARHGVYAVAALVAAWAAFVALDDATRSTLVERRLAHVWRQPGYATRACLRMQLLEGYLRDPTAWRGAVDARVKRLVQRYDIATVRQSPRWDLPRQAVPKAKPVRSTPLNVVVLFVDTLRADTASDPRVMPRLHELRQRSLDFTRAYATASDTVSSLPSLTGGCYGAGHCQGDVLALVRDRGIANVLIAAKSSQEFLAKESPHFAFDEVIPIPDYDGSKRVWGYGADQSTAAAVTQRSLQWMADREAGPFLLWALHFDVHNWMHIEKGPPIRLAAAPRARDNRRRYEAACARVDSAIGDLLDGMSKLSLDQTTAVLVVSDHGEALGEGGHNFHAVYLWESLVRVPLMIHVPGIEPRTVTWPVGHVDVAPTLAGLLEPTASAAAYHGTSLLAGEPSPDAEPLLLFSMRKNDLLRVGLVNRTAPHFKLELAIESAQPALFDLAQARPDAADVADKHRARTLELLAALVTSPVFPRPERQTDSNL